MDSHTIYLWSLILGGGLFSLSVIGGLGHDLHVDFGHDIGSFLDSHGIHIEHHEDVPSPISLRTLLAFLAGFGAVGLLAESNGVALVLGFLLALLGGIVLAALLWFGLVLLVSLQGSSVAIDRDFLTVEGEVMVSIPADGIGEIAAVVRGQHRALRARSHTGEPFKVGDKVVTLSYEGGVVSVGKDLRELTQTEYRKQLK